MPSAACGMPQPVCLNPKPYTLRRLTTHRKPYTCTANPTSARLFTMVIGRRPAE